MRPRITVELVVEQHEVTRHVSREIGIDQLFGGESSGCRHLELASEIVKAGADRALGGRLGEEHDSDVGEFLQSSADLLQEDTLAGAPPGEHDGALAAAKEPGNRRLRDAADRDLRIGPIPIVGIHTAIRSISGRMAR